MIPNPQSVCAKRNTWQAVCGLPEDHYIHHLELTKNAYAHKFEPSEPASLNAPAGTEEKHEEAKKDVAQDKEENQPRNETTLETAQTRSSVLAISPAPQPVAGEGAQVVTFKRNSNNGAGLHAVFVGDMPVHHFHHDKPAKVELYMNRLRAEIAKVADARFKEGYKEGLKDAPYCTLAEATPKPEEIAAKIQQELIGNIDGTWTKWFEDKCAAILRPFITPASTPQTCNQDYPCPVHGELHASKGEPMKINLNKEWCEKMGEKENGQSVDCGVPVCAHGPEIDCVCPAHPLNREGYLLGLEIEKLPPSEQQTKCMVQLSALRKKIRILKTPATPIESVRERQACVRCAAFENALDTLVAELEGLDLAMTRLSDGEFVTGYQIKTGIWHRILGQIRGGVYPVITKSTPLNCTDKEGEIMTIHDITAPWRDWPTEDLLRKIAMPEGFVAELRKRVSDSSVLEQRELAKLASPSVPLLDVGAAAREIVLERFKNFFTTLDRQEMEQKAIARIISQHLSSPRPAIEEGEIA